MAPSLIIPSLFYVSSTSPVLISFFTLLLPAPMQVNPIPALATNSLKLDKRRTLWIVLVQAVSAYSSPCQYPLFFTLSGTAQYFPNPKAQPSTPPQHGVFFYEVNWAWKPPSWSSLGTQYSRKIEGVVCTSFARPAWMIGGLPVFLAQWPRFRPWLKLAS
jgi:hypothetical protein